jgi:hypothetical protein
VAVNINEVSGKICKNCFWWTPTSSFTKTVITVPKTDNPEETEMVSLGACHRYAPSQYIVNTREDYWCGDFKER